MMRAWIGKSIVIIGAIHTAFGFAVFRPILGELVADGLINTVNGQPMREMAFWFIAFGLLAVIFGAFVDWCERKAVKLPKFLGWSLLALTLIIIAIMPISGGWLMIIPTVGAIFGSR